MMRVKDKIILRAQPSDSDANTRRAMSIFYNVRVTLSKTTSKIILVIACLRCCNNPLYNLLNEGHRLDVSGYWEAFRGWIHTASHFVQSSLTSKEAHSQ